MSQSTLVRRTGLSDRLYDDLLNGIVAGDFPINSRLPTEEQIAQDYGVSRSTVRTALARLKNAEYVVSRQGSGTVVKRTGGEKLHPFAPVGSLADLEKCYECRIALEGEIAALAAVRRNSGHIDVLDSHIEALTDVVARGEVHTSEDLDFHMLLARISGNQFFESILVSIRPHILFGMNISKTLLGASRQGHAESCLAEHREVVEAVKSGDGEAARDTVRHHLQESRTRLFGRA